MHVEKNFFENIMNIVFLTKDNTKSRLDFSDICDQAFLEVQPDGKYIFLPYGLQGDKKRAIFDWIRDDVEFTDGYASNLRNCIDYGEGKFTGMKSHDCHVVMQRLLPFAFAQLLDPDVHQAIA
ncbi:hypothetical protein V5N11_025485 [Cardamine amara subsp. amara]|uniref:Uncharacterized protein n=1 Tax=Cardamine amara subsp. amara TaxID=228776 RepID=A0ABD1BXT3_CARAN